MIVVMTSWAPVFAFRNPGTKPQAAPPTKPARIARGRWMTDGRSQAKTHVARGDPADEQLPLASDVEQPRAERERHREAR